MRNYFVIVERGDSVSVLGLQPKTRDEANSSISWQRTGGFKEPMHVCTYDRETREFVEVATGARFPCPTERGVYTESAFAAFLKRINGEG